MSYLLNIIEQPLFRTKNGINKEKQQLMLLFNNDLKTEDTLENLVSTQEYIKTKKDTVNLDAKTDDTIIDYKTKYENLLEDYNKLLERNKVECSYNQEVNIQWNDFDNNELYMSNIFNGEVIVPKSLLSLVCDIALEEKKTPKFEDITLLDLQKALLVLAKHSTPCILNELEKLNPKVIEFIWGSMNGSESTKQYDSAILSSITHFIDYLSNDTYNYVTQDMNLMLAVKEQASKDRKVD